MLLKLLLGCVVLWLPLPAALAVERPSAAVEVCVVAPRVESVDEGEAVGTVPTASPTLVVVEPLQQLRIETETGRLLWSRRAAAGQVLPSPLPWPLPPIHAAQQLVLRLQPLGASSDAFAHVRLRAAEAPRLAATAALIQRLGRRSEPWMRAINQALVAGDVPLAWSLLYAPQAPPGAALEALRRELLQRGCGDALSS